MVKKGVAVDLDALRHELREAGKGGPPNRIPSVREAIGVLLPEIESLRRDKWSDAAIAKWLGERGLEITPGTLGQYVREARRAGAATPPATEADTRSRPSPKPATVKAAKPALNVVAASPDMGSEAPKSEVSKPSPVRSPNAAAAIPAKKRVNDDA